MALLLTWFMITQSTLISYHTEAFVKTEVACTVLFNAARGIPTGNTYRNGIVKDYSGIFKFNIWMWWH